MRNLEIKNNDSLAPCGREKVYQSNLVNQSEGYLNIYSAPLTPALSLKGRGSQSGRSMIEMLGVLAIIGVLSVGGIAGYSKAMMKYRINKTIEQITLIAGNVRAFFAPQKNYIGVRCQGDACNNFGCFGHEKIDDDGTARGAYNGCPIVKKAGLLPPEILILSADGSRIIGINNLFGYPVSIEETSKSVSNDYQAFEIQYYIGDNLEACIDLLSQDWTAAGVKAISIHQRFFKVPVALDLAVSKCSELLNWLTTEHKQRGYPIMVFLFDIDINSAVWSGSWWQN